MRIAVWSIPPADLLVSGLRSGPRQDRIELLRTDVDDCEALLREGDVDVALLPTVSILRSPKDYDVFPAVALSSWRYPFVRLSSSHGLGEPIERIAYDPRYEQEHVVTKIVLREHYKMEPEFVVRPGATVEQLLRSDTDARLLVGPDVPGLSNDELTLDVGQEWYELAQYPMTWGLFATLRGDANADSIRAIRDGIRSSERQRSVWIRAQETSADLHAFYTNDLRLRLDDLALAGLTELMQFLFFYRIIEDVPEIPFAFLPEEESEGGRSPLI